MRDHVLIFINGVRTEVRGADVSMMLSDFLRQRTRLTGTKIVCAEGDCGACSVLIGRPANGLLSYRTVCSCILTVGQADGSHVVTVEGLTPEKGLSPVQAAMVKCHGAQCGFCTPGFVVAMHGVKEDGGGCGREGMRCSLAGNLCRCTGYDSILKAAEETEWDKVERVEDRYASGPILEALEAAGNGFGAGNVFKPATVEEALALRAEHPEAVVVSGGTDVGVMVNKGKVEPKKVILTAGLAAWRGVGMAREESRREHLRIGALATLTEIEEAFETFCPEAAAYLEWFASPQIRNVATAVGNIVTGSPIGDLLPVFLALGAEVELVSKAGGVRRVSLCEFYTGYRKSVMRADELVAAVCVPKPAEGAVIRCFKVARRKTLDISAVSGSFYFELDGGGERVIRKARIGFGGVAATPICLKEAEAFVTGKPLNEETMQAAAEVARNEIKPITDVRGSAEYRQKLVGNLFLKVVSEGD